MPSEGAIAWLNDVAARLQREHEGGAAQKPERLTVRELLGHFGYERRGQWIVARMREDLEARSLLTSPDFEFEYIDNSISIQLEDGGGGSDGLVADPTIRVGMLPAAHHQPVASSPDDPLEKATTIMRMEDYSQLPVMTGSHTVRGVVSWKSIGSAYAHGDVPSRVRECTVEAHLVGARMPLADATEIIYLHDYVLVCDRTGKITGIVTAADLAHRFKELTHPFLLIGELEHHLRNLVRRKFTVDELREASQSGENVQGPDDLNLGGYCRLLERPAAWEKLGLNIDRTEFIKRLHEVRRTRNEVLHFSAESLDPLEMRHLDRMAQFFRELSRLNGFGDRRELRASGDGR